MVKISFKEFMKLLDLDKAIKISIVVGIIITALLIVETNQERFSSLYLYPDSYTNFPDGNKTSFIFGVKSYENEKIGYDLQIFINDNLVDTKHFEIEPGKVYEEKETLEISNIQLPAKVKLELKSPFNMYNTHYWLKKSEETIFPINYIPTTPVPTLIPTTPVPTLIPTPSNASEITSIPVNQVATPIPISIPRNTSLTTIKIDRGFGPSVVNLSVGDKIVWYNNDVKERKITLLNKEGLFSKEIDIDKRFFFIFEAPGTYTFYIKEVPGVEGVVNVR